MGPTAGERQEENNAIPIQPNPTTRNSSIAQHNRTTKHNPEPDREALNYPKAHKHTNKYFENLKIWYTNADTLTPQKICELESRIKAELQDIICITEMYPKFSKNELPEAAYSIAGYDMIMTNNGRGIIIYTANHLKVHKIEIEEEFSEHLWVKVNISKDHCILVGTIYRSPNSSSENNDKLCSLLREVSKIKHDHIMINGDFNMKQLNWATREVSGEKNSFQYKLFDTINDTFLCENVKQPTRMRGSDKPSCLDWVLSENPLCISDMMVDAPLGPSDHSLIPFNYDCVIEKCGSDEMHSRSFYNGDYKSMREDLATLNWELEFEGLTTQQSWDKFYGKINGLIERHVPKKKYTTSKKIPWYGREIRTLSKKKRKKLGTNTKKLEIPKVGAYTPELETISYTR